MKLVGVYYNQNFNLFSEILIKSIIKPRYSPVWYGLFKSEKITFD